MEKELLHILQHSLGVDQYGQGRKYRNHYCGDGDQCRKLVAMGHMREHRASELSGGDPVFTVTPAGIDAVALESPAPPVPPKLTRSQRRYREFLRADYSGSFGEWLGVGLAH